MAAGLALLTAVAVMPGEASDLRGARQDALGSDLRQLRSRIDRGSRTVGQDLDRVWRLAWWLRVESPRDPRSFRRLDQIRDLRRRAERVARRPYAGTMLMETAVGSGPAGPFRQPPHGDLRGSTVPIGTGKRFILIQSGLRQAGRELDHGDAAASSRELAAARAELDALAVELQGLGQGDDPNLIALEAQLVLLDERLTAAAEPPAPR